uniref:Class I SAM-dependent methyltransferase n=1 Tax=Schlesneria paludicola TaxID=360056 RepID=A0A7C4QNL8_9PLAN
MTATFVETDVPRFDFGENWSQFLRTLSEERVAAAVHSLRQVCGPDGLQERTFLDIGCGSGLFSLAAYRLGASVTSFDYDPASVRCAEELRRRESADPARWRIERGSVLDAAYLEGLGQFDVVYAWGVLHHTGDLWRAMAGACERTTPGGLLWVAIYNDQGLASRVWRRIKAAYVRLPRMLRTPYVVLVGGSWLAWRLLVRFAQMTAATVLRAVTLRDPLKPWRQFRKDAAAAQRARGMHVWYDLVDWIGGYPFEVARPEEVFRFLRDRGFVLIELTTCGGGLGCNEFVFRRTRGTAPSAGREHPVAAP